MPVTTPARSAPFGLLASPRPPRGLTGLGLGAGLGAGLGLGFLFLARRRRAVCRIGLSCVWAKGALAARVQEHEHVIWNIAVLRRQDFECGG